MITESKKKQLETIISKRLKTITNKFRINFIKHKYEEKHRFYHNWSHVIDLVNKASYKNILTDDLLLAILFHDIIYLPSHKNNEEKSAELFIRYFPDNTNVYNAILNTSNHSGDDELSIQLNELDMSILYTKDLFEFSEYEKNISKEFSFVDKKVYLEKRVEFLINNNVSEIYIDYVKFLNK